MEITTEENRISIDGVSYPKDGFYVKPISKGVMLVAMSKSWSIKILVDGTTIDGSPVADRDELMTFFNEQGFKSGGTSPGPEVVTWDDVQDKPLKGLDTPLADSEGLVPVYTQNGQLPVGTPEFPENAVPLALLNAKVPDGGTNGQVLKKDASGNNVWSADTNSIYTVITEAEFNTGTSTTARAVSAVSLNRDINAKLDLRLSAAQRAAIDALVSPTEDYADMAEATTAIKSIIDALKAI